MAKNRKNIKKPLKKVKLTYTIEDKKELLRMLKSLDLCLALLNMGEWFRSITKYAGDDVPTSVLDERWRIREEFWSILKEYNIDLEELLD